MAGDYKVIYLFLKRNRDSGLIRLYHTLGAKEFRKVVKDSLRVLTRPGYIPKVIIPTIDELVDIPEYKDKSVRLSIKLSNNDKDVVDLLNNVKLGTIGNFVLDALKFYIGPIFAFNSNLVATEIETVPFYTPNGVIVFANTSSPFMTTTSRESKQQKIANINAAIAKREAKRKEENVFVSEPVESIPTPVETLPTPPVLVEDAPVSVNIEPELTNVPREAVPAPQEEILTEPAVQVTESTPQSIPQEIPQSVPNSSAVFAASEFGFEEQSEADGSDEDDVLALLEGLM